MEVFYTHHGIRNLDPKLKQYLKPRAVLDLGAFHGESALVLADYAPSVYSFELSVINFQVMQQVLAANPTYAQKVHPMRIAVADKVGQAAISSNGGLAANLGFADPSAPPTNVTTIDAFVAERNLIVGFIKVDVEGAALRVVRGAIETLKSQRPIFSIACYHSFDEFFGVPTLLMKLLPNYDFE